MTDQELVLCKWKRRLWPAKVRRNEEMFPVPVTFLCSRVSVSSANVVPLTEERIKAIASTLGEEGGAQTCCFVSLWGEKCPEKLSTNVLLCVFLR
uniref:PWWP domain-containing protein n=1 Tax=Zosterops lateralis melanops TaxID=1220523 RepID=A0A8D2PSI6_ZOSLA